MEGKSEGGLEKERGGLETEREVGGEREEGLVMEDEGV